jgi:hypothetical protein
MLFPRCESLPYSTSVLLEKLLFILKTPKTENSSSAKFLDYPRSVDPVL